MTTSQKEFKDEPRRYLKCFPTLSEVVQDPSSYTSDHVGKFSEIQSMRILSLNMLNQRYPSGFFTPTEKRKLKLEDEDKRISRVENMLMGSIDALKLDLILLQECAFKDIEKSKLLAALNKEHDNWGVVEKKESGLLMIYNKNKLKVHQLITSGATGKNREEKNMLLDRTQSVQFQNLAQDSSLTVHNVHWEHADVPVIAESLLSQLTDSVVIGDFNNRVVQKASPDHIKESYLVSTVTPPQFRKNDLQGADFTDGVFVVDKKGEISQSKSTRSVDPVTGSYCDDSVIPELKSFSLAQQEELLRPRFFISNTSEHKKEFASKEVLDYLSKEGITLRETCNAYNQRGLGFAFDHKKKPQHELIVFLKKYFPQVVTTAERETTFGIEKYAVYFPTEKLSAVWEGLSQFNQKNNEVFDAALLKIGSYFEQIEKEVKQLERDDNSEKAQIKKQKLEAVEKLKALVLGWKMRGTALEDKPFENAIQKLFAEEEKIMAGTTISFLGYKREPRIMTLLKALKTLDAHLEKIPQMGAELKRETKLENKG